MPARREPSPLPAHQEPPSTSRREPQKRDVSPDALELRSIGVKRGYLNFDSLDSYTEWQKAKNERCKEKESKRHTESRTSRENNALRGSCPSVRGAKVSILWRENDGSISLGEVDRSSQQDAWDDYTPNQRKYNGFINTWILSTLFAQAERPVNDSEDDDDDNYFPSIPLPGPSGPDFPTPSGLISVANFENDDRSSLPYVPYNLPRELPRLPAGPELTVTASKATMEDAKYMFPGEITLTKWVCPDDFETVLRTRYAFDFTPGQETHLPPVTGVLEKLKTLSFSLGGFAIGTESSVDHEAKYVQMLGFLQSICRKSPDALPFYKTCQSPFSTANADIKVDVFLNTDRGKLYLILPLSGQSDVSWLLVVPSLMTAVEIVKRDWGSSIRNIAYNLIIRGIPFHTLVTAQQIEQSYHIGYDGEARERYLPTIWSDREQALKNTDMIARSNKMREIFNSPHGRKGLLMGGVVWRWAMEFLQPEGALAGPSSSCLKNEPICSKDGVDFFDDVLIESELNIILGSYHVFSK